MPGEQAMLGGDTRDAEDLDGLIGDQRPQDRGSSAWVFQHHRGHVHDASVAVAERTIGADEFPHAVAACGCGWGKRFVQHVISFQRVRGSGSGVRAAARRRWPPSRGVVLESGVRRVGRDSPSRVAVLARS